MLDVKKPSTLQENPFTENILFSDVDTEAQRRSISLEKHPNIPILVGSVSGTLQGDVLMPDTGEPVYSYKEQYKPVESSGKIETAPDGISWNGIWPRETDVIIDGRDTKIVQLVSSMSVSTVGKWSEYKMFLPPGTISVSMGYDYSKLSVYNDGPFYMVFKFGDRPSRTARDVYQSHMTNTAAGKSFKHPDTSYFIDGTQTFERDANGSLWPIVSSGKEFTAIVGNTWGVLDGQTLYQNVYSMGLTHRSGYIKPSRWGGYLYHSLQHTGVDQYKGNAPTHRVTVDWEIYKKWYALAVERGWFDSDGNPREDVLHSWTVDDAAITGTASSTVGVVVPPLAVAQDLSPYIQAVSQISESVARLAAANKTINQHVTKLAQVASENGIKTNSSHSWTKLVEAYDSAIQASTSTVAQPTQQQLDEFNEKINTIVKQMKDYK